MAEPAPAGPLATRRFDTADQAHFAAFSGDSNPMHMDALYARRTQAGAPVVHGVHAVLWALDRLAAAGALPPPPFRLRVAFRSFLFVGQPATLAARPGKAANRRSFALESDGQPFATIDLLAAAATPDPAPAAAGRCGRIALPDAPGEAGLGQAALDRAIGAAAIAELALLSTLVGMHCPGLHSIFSSFDVTVAATAADPAPPVLDWALREQDDRFARLAIAVAGTAVAGEVVALERIGPVAGRAMASLAGLVGTSEFAGRRALIVGGSRGLGAATARLLAAGGGQVVLTYRLGRDEAEALVAEIGAATGDPAAAQAIGFAAGDDPDAAFAGVRGAGGFTELYYFATPKIFGAPRSGFDAGLFRDFARVYVDQLYPLIDWHARTSPAARPLLFAPSSIAVTDRPRGMTEYAMAKAAMEVMGADLARALPLRIVMPRLPRTETDQTATVPPIPAADAIEVMLGHLRATDPAAA